MSRRRRGRRQTFESRARARVALIVKRLFSSRRRNIR